MSGSSCTNCYHMFPLQTPGSHPAAKSTSFKKKQKKKPSVSSQAFGQSNTSHSPYSPKRRDSHCLHSTIALTALTPA